MFSKTQFISLCFAQASAAAIPNGEQTFVIRWTRDVTAEFDAATGTGYAVFDFQNGVVTGKSCNGSAICPPAGGWKESDCSDIKTGSYSPDGTALVNPKLFAEAERRRLEETWRGDHSLNNVYWNEPWMAEGASELTDELYGGVFDVAAGTITGIYNGGETNLRTGKITYTRPNCAAAEGALGGACKSDRSCTDIAGEGDAAATPQCCGVGTPDDGDAITDYCGDGLGSITATTGF